MSHAAGLAIVPYPHRFGFTDGHPAQHDGVPDRQEDRPGVLHGTKKHDAVLNRWQRATSSSSVMWGFPMPYLEATLSPIP